MDTGIVFIGIRLVQLKKRETKNKFKAKQRISFIKHRLVVILLKHPQISKSFLIDKSLIIESINYQSRMTLINVILRTSSSIIGYHLDQNRSQSICYDRSMIHELYIDVTTSHK